MRVFRRYSCLVLIPLTCLVWPALFHLLLNSLSTGQSGCTPGMAPHPQDTHHHNRHLPALGSSPVNYSHQYLHGLAKKPLLVRFKWYSAKKTPIHLG